MKKIPVILSILVAAYACGGDNTEQKAGSDEAATSMVNSGSSDYDTAKGAGKFKDFTPPANLDAALATSGEQVYTMKCASCHKLTDEKLVGPGWKGVTQRRQGAWILNFITNTDEMLNIDPEAQAQLEVCLVRMPNQNLTDEEAKGVYEFMRKNDGVK